MPQLGMVLYHGLESGLELRSYACLAEEAGYDSLWVTERYFHEETFSMLGYLAAVTQRLRLGVGVVNPYTRHPTLLAMASATLDRLSGGRFLLGVGRSERFLIQDRLGMSYQQSRAMLAETLAVLRALLAGQRLHSSSSRMTVRDARLALQPLQQPLPIYLAAIGPRALRLAGALADGVILNAYVPAAYVRYAVQEMRQAAQEAGRAPASVTTACMLVVRLTDDPERLFPSLKQRLVRLLAEPYIGEILLEKGGFDVDLVEPIRAAEAGKTDATALISAAMVEAFYLVGNAEHCRARLAEYAAAGVEMPLLLPRLEDFARVAEALRPQGSL
jgi:5,10-methylenetetrahydromethanopterin reductase